MLAAASGAGGLVPASPNGSGPEWMQGPLQGIGDLLGPTLTTPALFYLGMVAIFVSYLGLIVLSTRISRRTLVGGIGLALAVFTLAPPLLSQDVFSYISYARLDVVHGLNPYQFAPASQPQDPAFQYLGWPDTTSAYGPLFSVLTLPLAKLSVPAAYWTTKAVTTLVVAATLYLLQLASTRLGRDSRRALTVFALNPLVLVHVVGGPHNDALVALLLTGGVLLAVSARPSLSCSTATAAFFVKASAAVSLPFFVLASSRRERALVVTALTAAAIAAVTTLVFPGSLIDSLALVGENQAQVSFYSLPNQSARALAALSGMSNASALDLTRVLFLAMYGACYCWLLAAVWRGRLDWIEATGWAFFGLLIATAWLLPWYIAWLLPFAALADRGRLLAASVVITAYMLMIRVPL